MESHMWSKIERNEKFKVLFNNAIDAESQMSNGMEFQTTGEKQNTLAKSRGWLQNYKIWPSSIPT